MYIPITNIILTSILVFGTSTVRGCKNPLSDEKALSPCTTPQISGQPQASDSLSDSAPRFLACAVSAHWRPCLLRPLPTAQLPAALHISLDFLSTPSPFCNNLSPLISATGTHPGCADLPLVTDHKSRSWQMPGYPKSENTQNWTPSMSDSITSLLIS